MGDDNLKRVSEEISCDHCDHSDLLENMIQIEDISDEALKLYLLKNVTDKYNSCHENGPKLLPIHKKLGFDTRNKSLACSEPKLQFHSLKSSLASYSPYILFLTYRSS